MYITPKGKISPRHDDGYMNDLLHAAPNDDDIYVRSANAVHVGSSFQGRG